METAFLNFYLEEKDPGFLNLNLKESKPDIDAIRDKIKLVRGKIITENIISNTKNIISGHYIGRFEY